MPRLQAARGTSPVESSTPSPAEAEPRRPLFRFAIAALLVVALDQFTKHLVLSNLSSGEVVHVIGDILLLRLSFNSGGAFGIGQGLPGFFLAASVVVAVMIVVLARRVDDPRWIVPLGLVLGGGLGNLTDRVVRDTGGRVVDFIDFRVWPLFNIADASIVVGVIVMFVLGFRSERDEG